MHQNHTHKTTEPIDDQSAYFQLFLGRIFSSPLPMITTLLLYTSFSNGPLKARALILILLAIPFYSFHVAAPTRLGLFKECQIIFEELKVYLMQTICLFTGQSELISKIKSKHRENIVSYYNQASESSPLLWSAIQFDPSSFFHSRRLASFFAVLGVFAGLSLPLLYPQTFTFGEGTEGILTFLIDLGVFAIFSKVAAERFVLRLFEAHYSLQQNNPSIIRFRGAPILAILGASIGALAGLFVVTTGALACGFESSWGTSADSFMISSFWFLKENVPAAIGLSMAAGTIIGAGIGFSEKSTTKTQ